MPPPLTVLSRPSRMRWESGGAGDPFSGDNWHAISKIRRMDAENSKIRCPAVLELKAERWGLYLCSHLNPSEIAQSFEK